MVFANMFATIWTPLGVPVTPGSAKFLQALRSCSAGRSIIHDLTSRYKVFLPVFHHPLDVSTIHLVTVSGTFVLKSLIDWIAAKFHRLPISVLTLRDTMPRRVALETPGTVIMLLRGRLIQWRAAVYIYKSQKSFPNENKCM